MRLNPNHAAARERLREMRAGIREGEWKIRAKD